MKNLKEKSLRFFSFRASAPKKAHQAIHSQTFIFLKRKK